MSTIYFPLVMKSGELLYKRPGFCVGASAGAVLDAGVYKKLGLQVVGLGNFLWSKFEPVLGTFNFDYVRSFFRPWYAAKAAGIPAQIQFFGFPRWAQVDPVNGDSPIRWEYISNFIEVVDLVVKAVPELVYVQIFNEPDNAEGYEDHYGCLGDVELYLQVMRLAHELKNDHPNLIISMGLTTYTTQFFVDYAAGGGLKFVDQVNVHFYQGWGQVDAPLLVDEVKAIRGRTRSPIWVTEANLLHDGEATPDYLEAQRVWVYQQCMNTRTLGCEAYLPYALLSNWRNADILGRPAEATLEGLCAAFA